MSQFCERSTTRILLRSNIQTILLSSLLTSRIAYRVKDDRIDQLLHRGLVVGEVDSAGSLLARVAVLERAGRDFLRQRVIELLSVELEVAQACSGIRPDNDAV